jgi:hypothetical protein
VLVGDTGKPKLSWSYKEQSTIRLFFEDKESMETRVYKSAQVRFPPDESFL